MIHRTKNDLTAWALIKLGGPMKFGGPVQTRCHGGTYRGRAPQTDCLCPPKRGLFPEEINRLGASGAQIEVQISVFCGWRPFFFGDHLFWAGKTAWICDFGRKIPLTFCFSPCLFHPDWDKFLLPLCPSRIHTKQTSRAHPKFIYSPSNTLSWRRAWPGIDLRTPWKIFSLRPCFY